MAGNNLRLLDKKCSLRSQVCDLRSSIWHWLEIKQMFDNCTETYLVACSIGHLGVALIKILKVLIKLYGLEGFT